MVTAVSVCAIGMHPDTLHHVPPLAWTALLVVCPVEQGGGATGPWGLTPNLAALLDPCEVHATKMLGGGKSFLWYGRCCKESEPATLCLTCGLLHQWLSLPLT